MRKLEPAKSTEEKQPESIQELLKSSGSMLMKLVPGSDSDLDYKTFDWTLESFTEQEIRLRLSFDYPSFISNGLVDELYLEFHNTDTYLVPKNEGKEAIPDGYQIRIQLPTQTPLLLNEEYLITQG